MGVSGGSGSNRLEMNDGDDDCSGGGGELRAEYDDVGVGGGRRGWRCVGFVAGKYLVGWRLRGSDLPAGRLRLKILRCTVSM